MNQRETTYDVTGSELPEDTPYEFVKNGFIRGLLVAACVAGAGVLSYGRLIFVPTMSAFMFPVSGTSIGIAYGAFKGGHTRQGIIALLLWYLVLCGFSPYILWMYIMNGTYVTILALTMAAMPLLGDKLRLRHWSQRIILAALLIGIAHALTIVVLDLFRMQRFLGNPLRYLGFSLENLRRGTVIGLAAGMGMELAEVIVGRKETDRGYTAQRMA